MIEHITKSGKRICVWDNFFTLDNRSHILRSLMNVGFGLNLATDPLLTEYSAPLQLTCPLNMEQLKQTNFDIGSIVSDKHLMRAWANLNTANERTRYHADSSQSNHYSVLYYANLKWDINWDGGTVWRSEDLSEIEFISDYVPGRLVMFDSTIPHKAQQPSLEAAPYRITLNSIWQ